MESVGLEGQIGPLLSQTSQSKYFWLKFSWTSVMTLAIEPVGFEGQTDSFSSSNELRVGKTRFYQFSCAIIYEFLAI
ncbi:hypothetical protein H5410_026496 [Solanum commersonii]|uniref:Uncharacterized protein n=1 Tax=Solanum commersonii TaxID=4109 RepID=A0A9J5Z0V5_SOLCO|nr:hypothetical protein H5410_026496 [Solanum commersonii]